MNMIDFYAEEYDETNWNEFSKCFKKADIDIPEIPQDIICAVLGILGKETGYMWLHTSLQKFGDKNALELLKTPKGEKALKAYIMRLPN